MENSAHDALDDAAMTPERVPAWYLRFSVAVAGAAVASAILLFALSGQRLHIHAGLGINPAVCVSEDDDTARLECYDGALNRAQAQPARGATVPMRQ